MLFPLRSTRGGGISRIWVDVNFGISKCVWLCNLVKVCSPYVEEDDSESLPVSMETESQYMVVFSEENLDSATIFVAFGFLLPALPAEKCLKNTFIARREGNFFGGRIF